MRYTITHASSHASLLGLIRKRCFTGIYKMVTIMANNSVYVWIVTNQTTGVRWDAKGRKEYPLIAKGELVVKKEQVKLQEGVPPHNYMYCLLRDPDVTFYSDGNGIAPLVGAEADYLEGVQDCTARSVMYRREQHLQWIMGLTIGDMVYVRLRRSSKVPLHMQVVGKIRYYGPVGGRNGVTFGIEIVVRL